MSRRRIDCGIDGLTLEVEITVGEQMLRLSEQEASALRDKLEFALMKLDRLAPEFGVPGGWHG